MYPARTEFPGWQPVKLPAMKREMNDPSGNRASRSGGFLLALSIIVGSVAGIRLGEPSIGFLIGTGIGLLLLGLIWLIDRKR